MKRFLICASPVIGVVFGLMAVLTLKQQPPAEAMPMTPSVVAPSGGSSGPRDNQRDASVSDGRHQPGAAVATHN